MSASRLAPAPALDLLLACERGADVLELGRPDELYRPSVPRVRRPVIALVVLPHASGKIRRAADVVGAVRAAQDVCERHTGSVRAWRALRLCQSRFLWMAGFEARAWRPSHLNHRSSYGCQRPSWAAWRVYCAGSKNRS